MIKPLKDLRNLVGFRKLYTTFKNLENLLEDLKTPQRREEKNLYRIYKEILVDSTGSIWSLKYLESLTKFLKNSGGFGESLKDLEALKNLEGIQEVLMLQEVV